jgi:hypothetical protein
LFSNFLLYKTSSNRNSAELYWILPNFTKCDGIARIRFFCYDRIFKPWVVERERYFKLMSYAGQGRCEDDGCDQEMGRDERLWYYGLDAAECRARPGEGPNRSSWNCHRGRLLGVFAGHKNWVSLRKRVLKCWEWLCHVSLNGIQHVINKIHVVNWKKWWSVNYYYASTSSL